MTRVPRLIGVPEVFDGYVSAPGSVTVEEIVRGYVLVSWSAGDRSLDVPRYLYRLCSGRKPPLEVYVDEVDMRVVQVDVSVEDSDVLADPSLLPEEVDRTNGTRLRVDVSDWQESSWWEETGQEVLVLASDGIVAVLDPESRPTAATSSGSLTAYTASDGRIVAFGWRLDDEQLNLVRAVVSVT